MVSGAVGKAVRTALELIEDYCSYLQNWKRRADSLWICVSPSVQLFAPRG